MLAVFWGGLLPAAGAWATFDVMFFDAQAGEVVAAVAQAGQVAVLWPKLVNWLLILLQGLP